MSEALPVSVPVEDAASPANGDGGSVLSAGPARLQFSYDEPSDVLTIEGTRYSGDLFRAGGLGMGPTDPDVLLKILWKRDGIVAIQKLRDVELSRRFDEALIELLEPAEG